TPYEINYVIDDDIHIEFFRNPKFQRYLINYIKQETYSVDIDIKPGTSNDGELLYNYVIKLTGKKQ
ncbi:unnamed protein product, partial [Rotaria sp. Silwood2]